MDKFRIEYINGDDKPATKDFTHSGECNQMFRALKQDKTTVKMFRNDKLIATNNKVVI